MSIAPERSDERLARHQVLRSLATSPAVRVTSDDEIAVVDADTSNHSNVVKVPRLSDLREAFVR